MKYLLVIFLISACYRVQSQPADSTYLKRLYDRCLDFSEDQLDSLYYYADFISTEARRLQFNKGDVLSLRLKGVYYDLKGEYKNAIDYYLQALTAAQKIKGIEYEIAAMSDLAILYSHIKQPHKAKEMYLQSASLSGKKGYMTSLITSYSNLGAIYNQLNLPDSALVYLQEGLKHSKSFADQSELATLYNNLGNAYFNKKQYSRALNFFMMNKARHMPDSSLSDLWIDYLNIADVYIEMKKYDSAQWYADRALSMAKQLRSKSKESDSYALLAKFYTRKHDYQAALEYQRRWYELDTSLVNDETNTTIASLQEKYNSQKRQRENDLLQLEVEKQKLYKRATTYLAAASAVIALLIAVSLVQKRKINKKLHSINDLITRQNIKLTELNNEKNSLISIVSHDLGIPFASIKMWSQVLESGRSHLNEEQQRALSRIIESTTKGEALIRNILDVEKAEISQRPVCLENLDLATLVENVVDDFRPAAWKKGVSLTYDLPKHPLLFISDKQFLTRICENLISNALKFTPLGNAVTVSIAEEKEIIKILVKDEGIGIDPDELPLLFSKYSKISSKPTHGESSNGLGLSIVKRIVQELNGQISCESEPGKGSLFTVVFKK